MTKFHWRVPAALAASALAGVAIAAAAGSAAPTRPGDAGAAAEALAAAPAVTGATVAAGQARAAAADRARTVPLPAGGTFSGIQWEVGGGVWEPGAVEGVLEYNAACQWLRAWRDGREGALALKVLASAPDWPAMRGTESGELIAKVADEAGAGGGDTATAMLADCDSAHARETRYARGLGLTPTS